VKELQGLQKNIIASKNGVQHGLFFEKIRD
jgi:hypothetical protein